MLEKDITRKIVKYLNSLENCFVWKNHGDRFSIPGVPDVIGSYNGSFLGVEVKQPGKKPTQVQLLFHKQLRGAGALVYVATSLEEVKEWIASLKK